MLTARADTQRALVRRLTALLGLSAVWLVALCAPALAHAQFVSAEPARGAELQQAPEQVRLRFSEPVEAEFSPIEVLNSQGERVDQDNARVDPEDARVVEVGLGDSLPEGAYTVEWRVTSVDGHAVNGEYEFTVAASADASQGGEQADAGGEADQAGSGQDEPGQGSADEESQSTSRILLYSAISVGALIVVALASMAVVQARRRKP